MNNSQLRLLLQVLYDQNNMVEFVNLLKENGQLSKTFLFLQCTFNSDTFHKPIFNDSSKYIQHVMDSAIQLTQKTMDQLDGHTLCLFQEVSFEAAFVTSIHAVLKGHHYELCIEYTIDHLYSDIIVILHIGTRKIHWIIELKNLQLPYIYDGNNTLGYIYDQENKRSRKNTRDMFERFQEMAITRNTCHHYFPRKSKKPTKMSLDEIERDAIQQCHEYMKGYFVQETLRTALNEKKEKIVGNVIYAIGNSIQKTPIKELQQRQNVFTFVDASSL